MTELLTIRRAGPDDIEGIDRLLRRAFPRLLKHAYPPSTMVTAVPLLLRADPFQLRGGRHWVAVGNHERIIGAGGWSMSRRGWSGPRAGAVRQFVTDPALVRQGIGSALMARVVADARDHRVTVLGCQATLNAVPFYEAQGFRQKGLVEFPLAPAITFVAMSMARTL